MNNNNLDNLDNNNSRLDKSKSGSLDGQGEKRLLSLNENLDNLRHIDSVEETINNEGSDDLGTQE